jgi:hypothetical protein
MSKIQFNELNTSELEVLNNEATSEVVGGYGYWGGYYSSVYKNRSSRKTARVDQVNLNENTQVAFGGGKYSITENYNSTYQNNSANIYQ